MKFNSLFQTCNLGDVTSSENGITLRQLLHQRLSDRSKRSIQKKIDRGDIQVNCRPIKLGHVLLVQGDRVEIKQSLNPQCTDDISNLSDYIIWANEDFCAVDKPSGIESERMAAALGQSSWLLVHRLDKGTSGVLLMAKNSKMARLGHQAFRNKRTAKHYLALVSGRFLNRKTIRAPLKPRLKLKGKTLWQISSQHQVERGEERSAFTHFDCISHQETTSLVYCRPITGRTHQIRLHAAFMGHPIVGDDDYSHCVHHQFGRLMLHARRLVIPELDVDAISDIPQKITWTLSQLKLSVDPFKLNAFEERYGALSHQ